MTNKAYELDVTGIGQVTLTVDDSGEGHPFLLLHGGAGPQSVAAFSELLVHTHGARVITPTHPGFGGTPRPDTLSNPSGLAALYGELLEHLDVRDVTAIGNSIGGWIASELAISSTSRISKLVLVGATGIEVAEYPAIDFLSLSFDEVLKRSYFDPTTFRVDIANLPEAAKAIAAANRSTLAVYGGSTMGDPDLLGRLHGISVPTLVVWGDADEIVTPGYGRAYAAAIGGSRFELLTGTGHVPQIETPGKLLDAIWEFVNES